VSTLRTSWSDGLRPMKRPSLDDARSVPARCVKQGAVRWQGGVPRTDYFWFRLRGYSRILILCLERLIFFYLFPYLHRLLARGITMPLQCRHKTATAGIRSSATAQARQASERRPMPLPDGRHTCLFSTYALLLVFSFYFPIALVDMCGVDLLRLCP
jgi:hypothetical protein